MIRGSGGQKLQGLDVARSHRREVAVVQRGELGLTEPLGHSQDAGVDKANLQIGVGVQQFLDPLVIGGNEVLDRQRAASNLVEHRDEGSLVRVGAE